MRWCGHIYRRPIDIILKRRYCLEFTGISRIKVRFKKSWIKIEDLKTLILTSKIVFYRAY